VPFPSRDHKQAEQFALGYFERLRGCEDIFGTWLGLDALVQVRIQQPDVAVTIDTRGSREMRIEPGGWCRTPSLRRGP